MVSKSSDNCRRFLLICEDIFSSKCFSTAYKRTAAFLIPGTKLDGTRKYKNDMNNR